MKPLAYAFCLVWFIPIGLGGHLVLEEHRKLTALSATAQAVVSEKRLESHRRRSSSSGSSDTYYEPIVAYRFEAGGRKFTGERIFPNPFQIGGNLGRLAAKAPLERFEVGQETAAYYNPAEPEDACLIRRPWIIPYFVLLLGTMALCSYVAFWPAFEPRSAEFKQRKARWILAAWHAVGLTCAGHYLFLAGGDYGGAALLFFGLYIQLGLIPFVFNPSLASPPPGVFARLGDRILAGVTASLFGSFLGVWLGIAASWLALFFSSSALVRLQSMGYTLAGTTALFALLGFLFLKPAEQSPSRPRPRKRTRRKSSRRTSRRRKSTPTPNPAPAGPVPYLIDERPLPAGADLETLLPSQVGPFRRVSLDDPDDVWNTPIYAQYRSGSATVFVELGICDDPARVQQAIKTAKAETDAEFPGADQQLSLDTEPSYFKVQTHRGALMAWTRGNYYFSTHARSGADDLDGFVEAFPY